MGNIFPILDTRDFRFAPKASMTLTTDSPTCQIICRPYLPPDGPNINKCLNSLDCALFSSGCTSWTNAIVNRTNYTSVALLSFSPVLSLSNIAWSPVASQIQMIQVGTYTF